jgi:N-dimethylarginine dimethylaminohydrolase
MCPTDYFRIEKEINPWMNKNNQPDFKRARRQWGNLLVQYLKLDIEPWFIEPEPGCQDMCFTANAGWCRWGKMILSNFKGEIAEVRQAEIPKYQQWFGKYRDKLLNVEIIPWPEPNIAFEGQGDVVTLDIGKSKNEAIILMGYGQNRTDFEAANILTKIHNLSKEQIIPLKLTDERYYHLDTACVFIPPDHLLYFPEAFDGESVKKINSLPVKKTRVAEKDAKRLVCNGVFVVKKSGVFFLTNKPSEQFYRKVLRDYICHIIETDTSEFLKSGGSARCLTLFIPDENAENSEEVG